LGSSGQIEYTIDEIISRYDVTISEDKIRAVNEVIKYLSTLASRPEREIYSARAAEKLGLTAESVRTEVERLYGKQINKSRKEQGKNALKEQSGFGGNANADKLRFSSEASHEEQILGLLLIRSDFGPEAVKRLTADDFATSLNKKIFELFFDDFSEGREIVLSKDGILTAREIGALENCRASRLELGDITLSALNSHIDSLKTLRERSNYDKKIESDPAAALNEYLNMIKNKKTNIQEDKNG
jgi:DNA primase